MPFSRAWHIKDSKAGGWLRTVWVMSDSCRAPCWLRGVTRPLIFAFSTIYIVCMFIPYASPPILFCLLFSYLLVSPPLLIFFLWESTRSVSRPDVALVFRCLFCVAVHFFWFVNVCFCCVTFGFSIPSQEIGSGKRLRNDPFCVKWDVKPQLSLSLWQL